ncbi:MAG: hypothetical protein WC975_11520 [Phycisphaerae bacterium]
MLKKVGLLSVVGMVACVGCSAVQYAAITSGIVNTGVIAGGLGLAAVLPNAIDAIRAALGI